MELEKIQIPAYELVLGENSEHVVNITPISVIHDIEVDSYTENAKHKLKVCVEFDLSKHVGMVDNKFFTSLTLLMYIESHHGVQECTYIQFCPTTKTTRDNYRKRILYEDMYTNTGVSIDAITTAEETLTMFTNCFYNLHATPNNRHFNDNTNNSLGMGCKDGDFIVVRDFNKLINHVMNMYQSAVNNHSRFYYEDFNEFCTSCNGDDYGFSVQKVIKNHQELVVNEVSPSNVMRELATVLEVFTTVVDHINTTYTTESASVLSPIADYLKLEEL